MNEYRLLLPIMSVNFSDTNLTFSINHIRSRKPSILYFILHCYQMDTDNEGNPVEIYYDGSNVVTTTTNVAFTSERTVIGTAYDPNGRDFVYNFDINQLLVDATAYYRLEIVTLGVDSENPLYFAEMMFQEGEFNGYHTPSELTSSHLIELPSNLYANLYKSDGDYLQVIRPNKESFSTDKLNGAKYTILAPHFKDDTDMDSHVSVFLEALNQTEQTIDVLR